MYQLYSRIPSLGHNNQTLIWMPTFNEDEDIEDVHCEYVNYDSLKQSLNSNCDNFTLCHANVRSLRGKFHEFRNFLKYLNSNLTIVALTETHLSKNIDVNLHLKYYNSHNVYRNEYGGGIKVYIRNNVNATVLCNLSGVFDSYESLFLKIELDNKSVYVGTIYRPPGRSIGEFNVHIRALLDKFQANDNLVIMGDFNICIKKYNSDNNVTDFRLRYVSN